MGNQATHASWLPVELTPMAHNVDVLFYIMLGVVTFFFVLVEVLLITFLIRYRRTRTNRVGVNVHGNNLLETIWTAVPAIILVFMGAFSIHYVYALQVPPAQKYVIQVTGHEWYWEFKYPNGVDVQTNFEVPAGKNVLFDITSADVIHGFYIPAVRVQQDALPGRRTQFWINADTADVGQTFPVPCDQFCGPGHPAMVAYMKVVSEDEFNRWLNSQLQKQKAGT